MGTDRDSDRVHREPSYLIVGAAMRVPNELEPGLDEKLYGNALVMELRKRGLSVEQRKGFPVLYDGQLIGRLVSNLIVDDGVVVDPKVAEVFTPTHLARMTGYLAITGRKLALLLNFKNAGPGVKRVVRD